METQLFGEPKEQRKPRRTRYAETVSRNSETRKFSSGEVDDQGALALKVPVGTSAGSAVVEKPQPSVAPSQPLKPKPEMVPSKPAPLSELPVVISDTKSAGEKVCPLLKMLQSKAMKNQEAAGLNQDSLLTISQSEFHKILDNKDKKISDLEKQNAILLSEVKSLKKKHEDQFKLIDCEKEDKMKAERLLAQEKDGITKAMTEMVQLQAQLENQQKKSLEEKVALKGELEQLKQQLITQKSLAEKETFFLYEELRKKNELQTNTSKKVTELETAVSAEKTRAKEAEACLVQIEEEASKVKATLIQMQEEMRQQRHQWEQDKSRLLAEQMEAVLNMKSAVLDTQKVLEEEMLRWQKEKSCLLETITTLKENLMKAEEDRKTTMEKFTDRINNLGEQLENLNNPPKKKSVKGRFLWFFKRNERKPPQSDP